MVFTHANSPFVLKVGSGAKQKETLQRESALMRSLCREEQGEMLQRVMYTSEVFPLHIMSLGTNEQQQGGSSGQVKQEPQQSWGQQQVKVCNALNAGRNLIPMNKIY